MNHYQFSSEEKKALLDLIMSKHEEEMFERIIENASKEFILPGSCVIDGGANIGRHTVHFLDSVGETGRVYAVEAVKDLASRLDKKFSSIASYSSVNEALYKVPGISLSFNYIVNGSGYSGIKLRELPEDFIPEIEVLQVKTTTIDDILKNEDRRCSFIKLDLEGGEYFALKGANETLQKERPVIVFEDGRSYVSQWYGYDHKDFYFYLFAQGYCLISVFGEHLDTLEKWIEWNPWYTFALPKELLEKQSVILEKFAYELVKLIVK